MATASPEVEVAGRRLKLSNLDKVLYPQAGFTKAQVIDYYVRIAPVLLPHLKDRPLTLKRYPNGVDGEYFYEKNCPSHRPEWVKTAMVKSSDGAIRYCLCNDVATLVWTSNLADLELHTPLHTADDTTNPSMVVFDLDPGPPANILQCCRVATWLKALFDHWGLQSFAKTSGSKGMQLYVPFNQPGVTYADTKGFSRALAQLLEQEHPELVVSRMRKDLRPGKVLVDWSQNDEKKTTVCVYSLRARERPTVSTPVEWGEITRALKKEDPKLLTFEWDETLKRVEKKGDLFAPLLTLKQKLPELR